MDRRVIAGIAIVGLLLVGVSVALLPPSAEQETETPHQQIELAQIDDADETIFRITVFEDGDARWTVEHRKRITDDQAVEDFNTFADRFVEEETETFQNFRDRANRLTQDGTEITGREMTAAEFERDARYDEFTRDGVIEMSFRWEGFAETDGPQIIVSDVFDGGFVILEDQRLRVEHGDNLEFDSVSPDADRVASDTQSEPGEWVEWEGFREFESGEIDIRLFPPGESPDDDGQTGMDAEEDTGDDQENTNGSGRMIPFLMIVVVLAGVGGGALWYTKFRPRAGGAAEPETPVGTRQEPAAGEEIETEQLLSDEDRVIKLLDENGGRMRQVSIVEETEWSKSKVSMLLSDMEEEGDISKLRVGRENIISLAGEEPEAAGSPFDDEEDE